MQVTDSMRQYWNKNLLITAVLLFIWFVVTYVASFYARELNEITAERGGTVTRVAVENGEAVEYGQLLFLIEP